MSNSKHTDRQLEWTEVACEHLIQDEWIDFRRSRYRFPDGREYGPFYSYSRKSYVVIVAEDEDGNYLCVRQFRQGIRRVTVEFPAGGIETTEQTEYITAPTADTEAALDAAKRELREETGYASDDWTHLISIPSNATIADNYAHIFYVRSCKKAAQLDLDETEFLEPEVRTPDEIESFIQNGEFAQAMHVMAWEMVKSRKTCCNE